MQRVVGRKRRAGLEIGQDLGLQLLGERYAVLPVAFVARRPASEDDGIPCAGEASCLLPESIHLMGKPVAGLESAPTSGSVGSGPIFAS